MGSVQLSDNRAVSNSSQLEVSDALLVKGGNQSNISSDRLMTFIESIISKKEDEKEPFYVLDLEMVSSLVKKWNGSLPNVKPYYAVKCNHNPALLVELARLGAGFDCASRAEIQAAVALGIPSNTIIYANPCKAESHIKYAASVGVNLTTFDSLEELQKIKKWHSNCTLLLRIKAGDDGDARCPLGPKYGALPEEIPLLLQAAKTAKLNVAGVSFHVGSGVRKLEAYYSAIESAKAVFHTAEQLGMPKLHILNIGGGFSVGQKFDEAAITIRAALESYFPDNPSSLSVIAEPGRFFAETCFTLVTTIIGKRMRGDLREYWVNDGLYGSMNCILYDHATVIAMPLACSSSPVNPACQRSKEYSSTVFGPTCDALDTILTGCQLPELQVNDWLLFPNMGAYTACAGSKFNGFDTSAIPTYILANSNAT